MRPKINALVLGAGRFGSHYVRILSRLNGRRYPNTPDIRQLIVTRTTEKRARQTAADARTRIPVAVDSIISARVANSDDLKKVLNQHRPAFIAIAARDRQTGDAIHGQYATIALSYGAVLCEKPFLPASGDGASLRALKAIAARPYPHPLGLELPMAVVGRHLYKIPAVAAALQGAKEIRFHWEAASRSNVCLIDDLFLHPWSLLPGGYSVSILGQSTSSGLAEIGLQLCHRRIKRRLLCRVQLIRGGGMRSMSIDDVTFIFQNRGRWVRVFQIERALPGPDHLVAGLNLAREVLAVDNPLEQHIVAMLRQRPVIGYDKILQSQLLLEKLHGYAATESDG